MRDVRDRLSQGMAGCIQDCHECQVTCLATIQHCLRKGGVHADTRHIRVMMDCAEICSAAAGFMARSSDLHARTCAVCSEVCGQCAASCEKISGDEEMKACAQACWRCEASCREMAGQSAPETSG